jgi:uncharacterized protein (TIGR02117 family)
VRSATGVVMPLSIRWIARGLGLVAGLLVLYALAALVLGLVPRNPGFVEPADGVEIHVRTNGVHADLVLPTRWDGIDWSAEFPVRDMSRLVAPASWIAFGWGDRGFMLTTPTWADLRPGTAIIALSGLGRGAMHVEYVDSPGAYDARHVRLSAEQYRRLAAFIRDSFVRDAGGAVRRIDAPGYFGTDAFYEAQPTYTFWYTCNEWTRRALAAAGVTTAWWAPFDIAVMHHLPAGPMR